MRTKQVLQALERTDLPVRVFGAGDVTHVIVGELQTLDGRGIECVCLIAQVARPITDFFAELLDSDTCQCRRQKREGFPLCGICFGKLPAGLRSALKLSRGAALESAYGFAIRTLKSRRKAR